MRLRRLSQEKCLLEEFMVMYDENIVLCGSNSYEQKYYFNPDFNKLPGSIQDELKAMCVLFTEDVGGIMMLNFDEEGSLQINVESKETDYMFDEIGCGLKIKQIQTDKKDLFEALQMFYKVFFLGMEA